MATFLPACRGQRVKAVVRRRGYRPITRTFDKRADAELWAAQVEREMPKAYSPTSALPSASPCAA
jgi:hypothetical protein